ncbi:MAG: T9SS type A sorting domain-containing protein, partial [Bacteroidia bacterium]|nr:T9SS type A sorting domain-containing protein [Bacteroidia bacterium]
FVNSSTGWAGSFSDISNFGGIFKYSGPNLQMPPMANFSSPSTVCINAPVTMTNNSTGNPMPSYTWVVNPAATISNSNAANPSITFPSAGIYTITLTAVNTVSNSTSTKTINAVSCAGLQELNYSPIQAIYPVPASNYLIIQLSYKTFKTAIEIKDIVGKTVKTVKVANTSNVMVDVSDLTPGAYFIQMNEGGKTYVKKFIKE